MGSRLSSLSLSEPSKEFRASLTFCDTVPEADPSPCCAAHSAWSNVASAWAGAEHLLRSQLILWDCDRMKLWGELWGEIQRDTLCRT